MHFHHYDKREPRDYADKSSYVNFQGYRFHMAYGMIYWYRWGRYCFDIRVVRLHLGLPEENELDKDYTPQGFKKKMAQIISKIGCNDFLRFNLDIINKDCHCDHCKVSGDLPF